MSRKYTANEMREMALVEESYGWDVVAKMLRQAADMMDGGYEYYVLQCRRCQTARSGEGYGDTPPPIGDDDICDKCDIAKRIREYEEVKE